MAFFTIFSSTSMHTITLAAASSKNCAHHPSPSLTIAQRYKSVFARENETFSPRFTLAPANFKLSLVSVLHTGSSLEEQRTRRSHHWPSRKDKWPRSALLVLLADVSFCISLPARGEAPSVEEQAPVLVAGCWMWRDPLAGRVFRRK